MANNEITTNDRNNTETPIDRDQDPNRSQSILNVTKNNEKNNLLIAMDGTDKDLENSGHEVEGAGSKVNVELSPPGDIRACCQSTQCKTDTLTAFTYVTHLSEWEPENESFWKMYGSSIAYKNLWISVPNLLIAFAIWLVWSVVIVRIQDVHDYDKSKFTFDDWEKNMDDDEYQSVLLLLPAIAGLSGATLRLTNTFMIAVSGGPVTTSMTSFLFLAAMAVLGLTLTQSDPSFYSLIVAAVLSGAGGGAFSSSMNNISYFFPKASLGLALGLNAGIGNLGVSVSQLLIPIMMDNVTMYGSKGYPTDSASQIRVQNSGLFWLPFILIAVILAWFGLNSLPKQDVANKMKGTIGYWWLELIGFVGTVVAVVVLVITKEGMSTPGLKILRGFICVFAAIFVTVFLLRYATSLPFLGKTNEKLRSDFAIFKLKHTWIMMYLYVMTFGSFIGYSSVFPALIEDLFGYNKDGSVNKDAPDPLDYSWLGAFVGSLIRPVGGWLSDKYGGARVTNWAIILTILATIAVGIVIRVAEHDDSPQDMFVPFLLLFLVMFMTTGIGNGSTFRMAAVIFDEKTKGPVIGWISAIAAYGAFIFPIIFSVSLNEEVVEWAMYGFAMYYGTVWVVNFYYYYRKGCEIEC